MAVGLLSVGHPSIFEHFAATNITHETGDITLSEFESVEANGLVLPGQSQAFTLQP